MAVALLLANIVTVNLFVWYFVTALEAISALVSDTASASVSWMRPDNFSEHNHYRFVALMNWIGFTVGWCVLARRWRRRLEAPPALVAVLGVLVLSVSLALWALPYRLLWQSRLERVHRGAETCYIAGRTSSELLLFCPTSAPPRSRVVRAGDPDVTLDKTIDKIFTPLNTGAER
jgi:hypothetical protein